MTVNKDEFIETHKSVRRRDTRRLRVIFIISLGAIGLVAGFRKSVMTDPAVEDFFLSLVTRHRHWIPAGFGVLALGIFLPLAAFARKPGGIKCPKCGRSISSTITLLTSNCGRCGERIIA